MSLPCFNGEKPFTITPEQWIQRVDNARQAGAWTAEQTMGFITSAITGDALKWYNSLKTRGIDQNHWDTVKQQIIISYGTQINATNVCKGISKLNQGSKSVLNYFSEVCEVS